MMRFKNILSKIEFHWSQPRFRLFHTLYFNFRMLPFHDAWKLPILFYGPVSFIWLTGKIEIKGVISKGMIKIGKNFDYFSGANKSFLLIQGKIIFYGPCNISNSYNLRISNGAQLEIGKYVFIGANTRLVCVRNIKIGEHTQIGFGSTILDSNFHYLYNMETQAVLIRDKEIEIGKNNWIGNNTSIIKGAKTKDNTIVASNSLLNEDFSECAGAYLVIAGLPAKVRKTGVKRIYSLNYEEMLYKLFKEKNYPAQIILENFEDEFDSFERHYHRQ